MDHQNEKNIMSVSFAKINDDYTLGSCGNVDIIIMNSNGYVNAIKLELSRTDFTTWISLPMTKQLISAVESLSNPDTAALISNECSDIVLSQDVLGIYINPYLVPHLAVWIDPTMGIKVSKIINEYFIKQSNNISNNTITESPKMEELLMNQKKMMQQNDEIQDKLNCLTRVENPIPNIQNVFYIIKCNDTSVYNISGSKIRLPEYYVIETKKKMLSMKFNKIKTRHPNMVVIHETADLTIPSNLWSKLCGELGSNIEFEGHSFCLLDGYSEKCFLKYIKKFITTNF